MIARRIGELKSCGKNLAGLFFFQVFNCIAFPMTHRYILHRPIPCKKGCYAA
jgi:hypothetical protein